MAAHESRKSKYERIQRAIQESIFRDYPNPDRIGCPGSKAIHELAATSADISLEQDARWAHVTHCAECYREFLDATRGLRARRERVKLAARSGIAVAAVLVLGLVAWNLSKRPQNAESAKLFVPHVIELPAVLRAEGAPVSKPVELRRGLTELIVKLPVGSPPGEYALRLDRAGQTLFQASPRATISAGITSLSVKVDLTGFEPGEYSLVVRRVPFDWTYFPVIIR